MSTDPLIKILKLLAKTKVDFNWLLFLKERNKIRNRSIMINPKGKVDTYYDKINKFDVRLNKKENIKKAKLSKLAKN